MLPLSSFPQFLSSHLLPILNATKIVIPCFRNLLSPIHIDDPTISFIDDFHSFDIRLSFTVTNNSSHGIPLKGVSILLPKSERWSCVLCPKAPTDVPGDISFAVNRLSPSYTSLPVNLPSNSGQRISFLFRSQESNPLYASLLSYHAALVSNPDFDPSKSSIVHIRRSIFLRSSESNLKNSLFPLSLNLDVSSRSLSYHVYAQYDFQFDL